MDAGKISIFQICIEIQQALVMFKRKEPIRPSGIKHRIILSHNVIGGIYGPKVSY